MNSVLITAVNVIYSALFPDPAFLLSVLKAMDVKHVIAVTPHNHQSKDPAFAYLCQHLRGWGL